MQGNSIKVEQIFLEDTSSEKDNQVMIYIHYEQFLIRLVQQIETKEVRSVPHLKETKPGCLWTGVAT